MFLFLLLGFAYALECNVPHKEGHYHMTSVNSKNLVTECTFDIEGDVMYIEFERYAGRDFDSNAWMNFTFEGEPNVDFRWDPINWVWTNSFTECRPRRDSSFPYGLWYNSHPVKYRFISPRPEPSASDTSSRESIFPTATYAYWHPRP